MTRVRPRRLRAGVRLFTSLVFVACCAVPVSAQTASPVADPIFRALYEPELIMKHRRAIGLTDEQRDAISRLIRELQGQVVSLQWELQDQTAALTGELNRPRVDLDRALDRMGRVLQTERKIKEAHLTLLVRIKNVLRPEQQASLQQLRDAP
jgi:Spy/CpxP family protein refolding chaperone